MTTRAKMVRWFDPPQLAATAIRVAISTVFGEFADRREAMSMAREIDPDAIDPAYRYAAAEDGTAAGDFWFDFVADTGDGWNPTFAIARLLATPALKVEGLSEPLPMGRLLVMGGDQVYPTASRDEYQRRLIAPFEAAAQGQPWRTDPPSVHLYAVPGNHDWYDGLLAFLGIFCRRRQAGAFAAARDGRDVGGRRTQQTRSYFALELPHNWWLWAVDVQLKGYVDQPQIDFFVNAAEKWMPEGARVILCTGQPSWVLVDEANPEPAFKNFDYVAALPAQAERGHRLCVVLTGDSHHYSRYSEGDCQYVTAGGGGAFLHPTHHLKRQKAFTWSYPSPGQPREPGQTAYRRNFELARDPASQQDSLYPPAATSRALTWRLLGFALLNPIYAATIGVLYVFFTWLLQSQAHYLGGDLLTTLAAGSLADGVGAYLGLMVQSPWPVALALAAMGGYVYLADFRGVRRALVGCGHAMVQGVALLLLTCLLARWLPGAGVVGLIVLVGVVGGVISATLLGIYLLLCLNLTGHHWNEAFSALRIEDYKNFLRLRIGANGKLLIYPIGLERVPRDGNGATALRPHVIEGPIEVG